MKDVKDTTCTFRLSVAEKQHLIDKAKAYNITLSNYIIRKLSLPDVTEAGKGDFNNNRDNRLTNFIGLRVSNQEKAKIEEQSKLAKLSVSQYIIHSVLSGEDVFVIEDLKPFIFQLSKLGNNINQLTILAREGKIEAITLDEVNIMLENIYGVLKQITKKTAKKRQ